MNCDNYSYYQIEIQAPKKEMRRKNLLTSFGLTFRNHCSIHNSKSLSNK